VRAHFVAALGEGKATPCRVVNRSRTGLALVVRQPIEVGTMLQVRADDAPETVPWVAIQVRNCRARRKHWIVGCQFQQELPWDILLLFG
jgi:hypothetical protein